MSTSHVLRIGREPDNDFVVNLATVSGYHASVTWSGRPGEAMIEDIGSTNGTAVGSIDRRGTRAVFTAADTIYLGTHALPGSQLLDALSALGNAATQRDELKIGAGAVVVGRDPGCDRVVDSPVVSSRHARITRRGDGSITVEDLNSANGTYINGRRIDLIGAARPGDTIALGSYSLVLAVDPAVASPVTQPIAPRTFTPPKSPAELPPLSAEPSIGSELAEAWRAAWTMKWRLAIFLCFGAMQGITANLPDGPAAGVGPALASNLSRLGWIAVVWGLVAGINGMNSVPAAAGVQNWLARATIPAVLGLANCLLAWLVGQVLAGGRLGGAGSLLVLMLGSGAGTALGLLVGAFSPRQKVAWIAFGLLAIPIWIFGGSESIWLRLPGWAKTAAAVNPARWTFEGLMVNASDRLPVQVAEGAPPTDLAEPYFPAETERIGPRGASLALAALLLGWGVAAAFITASPRPLSANRPVP